MSNVRYFKLVGSENYMIPALHPDPIKRGQTIRVSNPAMVALIEGEGENSADGRFLPTFEDVTAKVEAQLAAQLQSVAKEPAKEEQPAQQEEQVAEKAPEQPAKAVVPKIERSQRRAGRK